MLNKYILVIIAVLSSVVSSLAMPSILFINEKAPERKMSINASFDTGILYGMIQEYVYTDNRTLSKLDWDLKPLVYAGFSIVGTYNNILLSFASWHGCNSNLGLMEDYDWVEPGTLTHYSRHSNVLEKAVFTEISTGVRIINTGTFSFSTIAGFNYSLVKMSARNGYIEYPPGSLREDVYGLGIIYEQKYYIPYLGLALTKMYGDNSGIIAAIKFSFFGTCKAVDNHIKTGIDYYDRVESVRFIHVEAGVFYNISDNTRFFISPAYTFIPEQSGNSYWINTNTGTRSDNIKDSAGIAYRAYQIKASVSYSFISPHANIH